MQATQIDLQIDSQRRNRARLTGLAVATSIAFLVQPAGILHADWVTLQNGKIHRGIFAKKHSDKAYRFTLETGETILLAKDEIHYIERSPKGEKVEFRGKKVTLKKKIATLQEERRKLKQERLKKLERWARGAPEAEANAAREALQNLPLIDRVHVLAHGLRRSRTTAARELAARELVAPASDLTEELVSLNSLVDGTAGGGISKKLPGDLRAHAHTAPNDERKSLVARAEREILYSLSRCVLIDDSNRVRGTALRSLGKIGHADMALYFTPALASSAPIVRERAARVLEIFPDRRAADELVSTLHLSWSGFGRGYFQQGTQRAYVADYELVSGGTGFSIVEVADPVVRTLQTGVVLDVKVRKVEMIARFGALEKITGQKFGRDVNRWKRWLAEHPAK